MLSSTLVLTCGCEVGRALRHLPAHLLDVATVVGRDVRDVELLQHELRVRKRAVRVVTAREMERRGQTGRGACV